MMLYPLSQAAPGAGESQLLEMLLKPGNLAASTLLVVIVLAFIRGWIVPGWLYREVKERADKMEERALKSTEIAKQAVDTVERAATASMAQRADRAQQ